MTLRLPLLPAAATAALSSACAAWTAGQMLSLDAFTRAALLGLSAGYLTAAAAHWRPVALLRVAAAGLLGLAAARCLRPDPPAALAACAEILRQHTCSSLLLGLVFAIVLFAFVAGTPLRSRRVPMAIAAVPSLSIYGLAGAFSSGPGLNASFFGFLFGAVYTLAYEHRLAQQDAAGAPPGPVAATAAGVTACYLALLLPLSFPLSALSQRLAAGMSSAERDDLRRSLFSNGDDPGYAGFSDTVGLGGGMRSTGEQPLMRVCTPDPGVIRGRIYDVYEHNHWSRSALAQRRRGVADTRRKRSRQQLREVMIRLADPTTDDDQERPAYGPRRRFALSPPAHLLPPPGHAHRVSQQITILGKVPGSAYCVGVPLEITTDRADLTVEATGVVYGDAGWQRGDDYQVVSLVPAVPEAVLRRAPGGSPPEEGNWWQIPASVTPARELASRIAGRRRTPYARAQAIADYLSEHYAYSLAAPAVPEEEDAVCHFLTEGKKGACDLFAGATVVLSRCVGVPARLVTGYLLNEQESGGSYLVRERDAHAWAEVYVPPYGWVPIDPTPDSLAPAGQSPALVALGWWKRLPARTLAVIAEALLLGMALGALLRARSGGRGADPAVRFRPRPSDARGVAQQAYHRACRHLARRGVPRPPGQTPGEYLETLAAAAIPPETRQQMADLTGLFERACYAPAGAALPDAGAAREMCAAVRRLPSRWRRSKAVEFRE